MRIQIALSNDDKKEDKKEDDTPSNVAPAPQKFGSDYSNWMDKMKNKENFGEVKRLDNNKLVAVDKGGNTIETFVLPTERGNIKTDTLDSEQGNAPKDKTENDVRVDSKLEKGA